MKHRFIPAVAALTALLSCVAGCPPFIPVMPIPEPVTIPIKVWVVLAQGEQLHPDGMEYALRDNKGCRFTELEIRERVNLLVGHASMYGPWVIFEWDEQPEVIEWSQLAQAEGRHMTTTQFRVQLLLAVENRDETKINIYFTGFISSSPDHYVYGLTDEPEGEDPFYMLPPFIAINDNGELADSGFDGFTPEECSHHFILEHEMTHYLARFTNRCFAAPSGTTCYDSNEHADFFSYNVLSTWVPVHLHIPGDFYDLYSEKGEIWSRILSGDWNEQ